MTGATTLTPPTHSGSRPQAQAITAALPVDLSATDVLLDCAGMTVGAPSFLDELIKQVLVSRRAKSLEVVAAPERVRELLERAAANHGVEERLRVAARGA